MKVIDIGGDDTSMDDVLAEVAKYLSKDNENVKRGYLLPAIRDLAQAKVSAFDNVTQLEQREARLLDVAERLIALADGVYNVQGATYDEFVHLVAEMRATS